MRSPFTAQPAQSHARRGVLSGTIAASLRTRTWFSALEEDRPLGTVSQPLKPWRMYAHVLTRRFTVLFGSQSSEVSKVYDSAKACVFSFAL